MLKQRSSCIARRSDKDHARHIDRIAHGSRRYYYSLFMYGAIMQLSNGTRRAGHSQLVCEPNFTASACLAMHRDYCTLPTVATTCTITTIVHT
jgi:hypothetical protein